MPRFTFNTAILTGATANPLNGWQYEYLPWNAVVRVLAQTTATGVKLSDCRPVLQAVSSAA